QVVGTQTVEASRIGVARGGQRGIRAARVVGSAQRLTEPEQGLRTVVGGGYTGGEVAPASSGVRKIAQPELDERQPKLRIGGARARVRLRHDALVGLHRPIQVGQAFADATTPEVAVGGFGRVRKVLRDCFEHADADAVLVETYERY